MLLVFSTCMDVQIYSIFLFKDNILTSHFYTEIKFWGFFFKQLEFLFCSVCLIVHLATYLLYSRHGEMCSCKLLI